MLISGLSFHFLFLLHLRPSTLIFSSPISFFFYSFSSFPPFLLFRFFSSVPPAIALFYILFNSLISRPISIFSSLFPSHSPLKPYYYLCNSQIFKKLFLVLLILLLLSFSHSFPPFSSFYSSPLLSFPSTPLFLPLFPPSFSFLFFPISPLSSPHLLLLSILPDLYLHISLSTNRFCNTIWVNMTIL